MAAFLLAIWVGASILGRRQALDDDVRADFTRVSGATLTLLGLIIGLVLVRVKREDLEGINPMAAPADTVPESADAIAATAD